MTAPIRYGMVLILSGPSGAGKSTLTSRALAEFPDLSFSISCTTRALRGGEKDGVDYYFLSREKFEEHIANGDFLEYACVHGNFYGTLRSEVARRVEEGRDVILDIDVQGAQKILERAEKDELLAKCVETVFIAPP
ncbi:MAG: guanylate kinase, partial [Lentisphaeria bacterium]|nr:guanylate kinase [Lentisphaeria bacterium]